MEQFPHLKFIQKLEGKPRFSGGGEPNPTSEENRRNRQSHAGRLSRSTSTVRDRWVADFAEREALNLAPLNADIQPITYPAQPKLVKQA